MRIQAIIETAIYVDDLDATERFYGDVFGLRVIAKEPGRHVHVFFQVGTSSVLLAFIAETTLKAGEKTPHGAKGPGHFAMGIEAESLDAWRQMLQKNGIAIEDEVTWPRAAGRSTSVILPTTALKW